MKRFAVVGFVIAAVWLVGLPPLESSPPPPAAKRINRAIELLEKGQPIYYQQISAPTSDAYETGKKMAGTWADYISYEMEHGAFNIANLREFMRGLADAGPTKSGHQTPAVICTLPVGGLDEFTMKANYWMVEQVLSSGVHGILLCHARSVDAVRYFVRAARYPTQKAGLGQGLDEGLRGAGSQSFASKIWGISSAEYTERADPWPLNPNGEILLGLKIEDRHALQNTELTTKVPGIGFAEWGPGDMHVSHGLTRRRGQPLHPLMAQARDRVFNACKAAKISFLNGVSPDNVTQLLDEGVMISSGGQEAAEVGRRHTKREMPW